MPKFQNVNNPQQIIEVSEDRAVILRGPSQDGWKEVIEKPVEQVSVNEAPPKKKSGRPRKER